jgi:conjugal transfer/type IV secretion protein DotA/TraY
MAMNDAGNDFFVAKAGDWMADTVSTFYAQDSIIAGVVGLYNAIILAIGGTLLLWIFTRAIVETAQHGRVVGKHSEVWFPIRLFLCVGLIMPVPPTGLNAAEYIVVGIAKMGSAAAGKVWDKAVQQTVDYKPLVVPVAPDTRDLLRRLWALETCMAIQNAVAATSNGATIKVNRYNFDNRVVLAADGDERAGGIKGQCGAIVFSTSNTTIEGGFKGLPQARRILDDHYRAAELMRQRLSPAATALAKRLLPPFDQNVTVPDVDLQALMVEYTNKVMNSARSLVQNETSNSQMSAFKEAATGQGFVLAGAWAGRMMAANEELIKAVHATPKVSAPQMEYWAQSPVWLSAQAAILGADDYLVRRLRTVKDIDAQAYLAGTQDDAFGAFFDISRRKALYDAVLVMNAQSPNPLGEMVNTGHTLLLIVYGAVMSVASIKATAAVVDNAAHTTLIGMIGNNLTGGVVTGFAKGSIAIIETVGPMMWLMLFGLLGAGIALAYILPMTAPVMWLFALAHYFMRVNGTFVGAPLWGLTHLALDGGDGIPDQAKRGYYMCLDILLRPMILTIGIIVGYGAIFIFGHLHATLFLDAVRNSISGHFGGITGLAVMTILGSGVFIVLNGIAFWQLNKGADFVLEFITAGGVSRSDRDGEHDTNAGAAGAKAGGQKAEHSLQTGALPRPHPGNPVKDGGGSGTGSAGWAPRMEDSIPSADRVDRGFEPPPRGA